MTSTGDDARVAVWDADAHICEPPAVWREYAEPAFRDLVMQVHRHPDGHETGFAGGVDLGMNVAPACIPGMYGNQAATWDQILPGSYDPVARLEVMDEEGLDHAVCFPSLYLVSGDIADGQVAAASARAYNSWMADFVATDPERLFGIAVCPLQVVAASVAEIERVADLGLSGITFRPERYNGLELYSEDMDRVWSAAEYANLTVAVHGSFGSKMSSFARTRYANQFFVHMVCHPFEQMACVMEVVASGVLDKHPGLRVGFFESGLGWLPYWLDRLDEHKESMGHLVPTLKRDPTEIWSEQCFVTMEAGEGEALAQLADLGLAHTVVWGSDYPHYDCTYPGALAELDATFDELAKPDLRTAVIHDNARRFLGLPELKLARPTLS
ncbi:MAG: amidohydrolase family protein [Acidimicrobiia bacterium]|nr:amidohydrolase family protein [Acidimicrobiia bacterium]